MCFLNQSEDSDMTSNQRLDQSAAWEVTSQDYDLCRSGCAEISVDGVGVVRVVAVRVGRVIIVITVSVIGVCGWMKEFNVSFALVMPNRPAGAMVMK